MANEIKTRDAIQSLKPNAKWTLTGSSLNWLDSEYPSVQDQLDMQYWDSVNGTTTWATAIAKVKTDNPKP